MLVGISPVAIAAKIDVFSTGDSAVNRANLYLRCRRRTRGYDSAAGGRNCESWSQQ
jgi:hypothetical protein